MPKKQKNKAKEASDKLSKPTLDSIRKIAVTYSVYEQRLATRATLNAEEKRNLVNQFMGTYYDELRPLIYMPRLWEYEDHTLEWKGFDKVSIALIRTFGAYATSMGNNYLTEKALGNTSEAFSIAKESIEKGAKKGASGHSETDDLGISASQRDGLRDIAKWMYRNAEDRTASRRGSTHLGWTSHIVFVEEILKKTVKQKLLIYYLIEKGKTNNCTPEDVIDSQTYIPDLTTFKTKILKNKFKRFFAKESVQWSLLGLAVQQAGAAIGSSSAFSLPQAKNEEEKARQEAKTKKDLALLSRSQDQRNQDDEDWELNDDAGEEYDVEDPNLEDQLRLLPIISSRLRKLIDSDEGKKGSKDVRGVQFEKGSDKEKEYIQLITALDRIKLNMADYFYKEYQADPNGHAQDKLEDSGQTPIPNLLKKAGDGLSKLPLTATMAAGTAASALAVIIRVGGLIKNYKILSYEDVMERVLTLGAACEDLIANASKLGIVSSAANVTSAIATTTMLGGAIGVVSGGLSMGSAAINIKKADSLRKGTNEAGKHLANARLRAGDDTEAIESDLEMAEEVQQFLRSVYHVKAIAAGKDMLAGTLTAIGGALALTGVGMAAAIPLMVAGLVVNIGGMIAGKIVSSKEKSKMLDRFFGLDVIMEQLVSQKIVPNKWKVKKAILKELRTYAEAKIGAADDAQAYKIIMSRYAHFLYMKTFVKKNGEGYYTAADYEGKPNGPDEELAFACKAMVSSLGVHLKFGATKDDPPKTTETDIRRRMKL